MPAARAQTIKQAKASYSKNTKGGPKLTERERKQLERSIVLQERADKERERESRRQWAIKQRVKREEQEREKRQQQGVGLATQLAGYSHTQKRMKNAMEGFLSKAVVHQGKEEVSNKDAIESENKAEVEEYDIDVRILDDELTRHEMDAGADTSIELTMMPFTKPVTQDSLKKRGPFRTSQSFGDSLDDDSLFEAESETADVTDASNNKPVNPLKRLFAEVTEASATEVTPVRTDPRPVKRMATDTSLADASAQCISRSVPYGAQPVAAITSSTMLDYDLADLFPSNTQVAHELTPPKIISSKSLLLQHSVPTKARPFRRVDPLGQNVDSRQRDRLYARPGVDVVPQPTRLIPETTMPPPPRPAPRSDFPKRSPKRSLEQNKSAFGDFGLSTQLVHAIIDDELDLSDEDDDDQFVLPSSQGHSSFGAEIDFSDIDLDLEADFG